jgi:hypothetical protein
MPRRVKTRMEFQTAILLFEWLRRRDKLNTTSILRQCPVSLNRSLISRYEDINKVLSGEVKSKRIKIGKEAKAA